MRVRDGVENSNDRLNSRQMLSEERIVLTDLAAAWPRELVVKVIGLVAHTQILDHLEAQSKMLDELIHTIVGLQRSDVAEGLAMIPRVATLLLH